MNEYKVISNGDGTYSILCNEVVIPKARVKQIYFSEVTSHTYHGDVHHVSGPCKALISVPEEGDISDVLVVFN